MTDDFAVLPSAEITAQLDDGGVATVLVAFDRALGRFAVASINVVAQPGTEVTGAQLRTLRVQDFVQEAVDYMVFVKFEDGDWHQFSGVEDYLDETAENAPDQVRHVAQIYSIAKLVNRPPLKAVAEVMQVSQSTATRMIRRARADGLLTQPETWLPPRSGRIALFDGTVHDG